MPAPWQRITPADTYESSLIFRDEYFSVLTDPTQWPLVRERTTTLSFLINTLAIASPSQRLQLAQFLQANPDLKVDVIVNGINIRFGTDCTDPAARTFAESSAVIDDWLALASQGARLDSLTADHGITWTWINELENPVCPSLTPQDYAAYLGTAFDLWTARYPSIQELGMWEGSVFQVTDENATGGVWPAAAGFVDPVTLQPIELSDIVDLVRQNIAGRLDLGRFTIDHDTFAVDLDDGAIDDDNWEFGRVIAIESLMRDKGLRVGISNHLGREFRRIWMCEGCNGDPDCPVEGGRCMLFKATPENPIPNPAEFTCGLTIKACQYACSPVGPNTCRAAAAREAHNIFHRYASEYLQAGGHPDNFEAFSWHWNPTVIGPESVDDTQLDIYKDVLTDIYPPLLLVSYFSDDFSSPNLDPLWTAAAEWQISGGALTQNQDSGLHQAFLAGQYASFDLSWTLELGSSSNIGNSWAGVQVRTLSPGDPSWGANGSGYLIVVRDNGRVQLVKPCSGCASNIVGKSDGLLDTSLPIALRVKLRGQRLQVFANGEEVIDKTDPDGSVGYLNLVTFQQAATFDDISLDQARLRRVVLTDDFSDGDHLDTWTTPHGLWNAASQELAQLEISDGLANALAVAHPTQIDDLAALRMTTRIHLPTATAHGWAGLNLRKTTAGAAPWATPSYLINLRRHQGLARLTVSRSGTDLEQADFARDLGDATAPVELEVVMVDHRIRVAVDGILRIDVLDTAGPTSGQVSLTTFGQDAIFDDVLIERLD